MAEAVDFVVEVSLSHQHVYEVIAKLNIDVLVFADTMSEPMNHFLAHARMANIQVAIIHLSYHFVNVRMYVCM